MSVKSNWILLLEILLSLITANAHLMHILRNYRVCCGTADHNRSCDVFKLTMVSNKFSQVQNRRPLVTYPFLEKTHPVKHLSDPHLLISSSLKSETWKSFFLLILMIILFLYCYSQNKLCVSPECRRPPTPFTSDVRVSKLVDNLIVQNLTVLLLFEEQNWTACNESSKAAPILQYSKL